MKAKFEGACMRATAEASCVRAKGEGSHMRATLYYVSKGKNAVAIETHVRTPISPVVITTAVYAKARTGSCCSTALQT